jgi:hypothetical protein
MTAVVGVYVHPKACPCQDARQMKFAPVRVRDGVVAVPEIGAVIDCPHCTDASDMLRLLPDAGPDLGGVA